MVRTWEASQLWLRSWEGAQRGVCGLPGLRLWEGVCKAPGALGPLLKALAWASTTSLQCAVNLAPEEGRQPSCRFAKEETCGAKVAWGQSRLQSWGGGCLGTASDSRKEGARRGSSPAQVVEWRLGGRPRDRPLRPTPAAGAGGGALGSGA